MLEFVGGLVVLGAVLHWLGMLRVENRDGTIRIDIGAEDDE